MDKLPCQLAGNGCECTGACLAPELDVRCTVCGWAGTARDERARALEPGKTLPMGRVFKCPGCNRRQTCNGNARGKKA